MCTWKVSTTAKRYNEAGCESRLSTTTVKLVEHDEKSRKFGVLGDALSDWCQVELQMVVYGMRVVVACTMPMECIGWHAQRFSLDVRVRLGEHVLARLTWCKESYYRGCTCSCQHKKVHCLNQFMDETTASQDPNSRISRH